MTRTQDLSPDVKRHLLARITAWRRHGLSARASTVLALAGCDTVEQITALGRGYFEGRPNCAGKTLQELADLAGWSPEHRTPVDAVAASLRLSISDPAEARNAATDAVIGLRRAGFVIAARRSELRIPTKPTIDSDANQPPVPIEASQAFRRKPAGVAVWSEGGIIRLLSLWSRQA